MTLSHLMLASCAVLLLAVAQLPAQEILTDRPDQTETATVVPTGTVQVESGVAIEFDGPEESRSRTTTAGALVRVGLLSTLELRLAGASIDQSVGDLSVNGLGDVAVGAKISIAREMGDLPEMALIAELALPVGEESVRSNELLPLLRMAFSRTLGDASSLGLNLGAEWQEGNSAAQGFYTLSFGSELVEKVGGYIELFGTMGADIPPAHSADGGLTWLVAERAQLDLSVGVGISPAAPDYFVSGGLSFRIPY